MNIPTLDEGVIKKRAMGRSWDRGYDLYENGAIDRVLWRDGVVTASVYGSQYTPYEITLRFDGASITSTGCTCPYDHGGDCKHIIAVGLHLIHAPDDVERKLPLSTMLAELDLAQSHALITTICQAHPNATETVEEFVKEQELVKAVETADTTDSSKSNTTTSIISKAEIESFRRQIKSDVRNQANNGGYNDYYDEWEGNIGDALNPAQERIRQLLDVAMTRDALALLTAVTEAWDGAVNSLDEYYLESFDDMESDNTVELGELWAEAVLSADLTPAEQIEWHDKLDQMEEDVWGGSSFEIATNAAEHHWTHPLLLAVMGGDIDRNIWGEDDEDEIPYYADELTAIRLRILEQREQYDAYLNLAQSEGEQVLYLNMLVKQGRSDEAADQAISLLTQPDQFLAVGRTLAEHAQVETAIRLGLHGLEQAKNSPPLHQYARDKRTDLAEWLRDLAQSHKKPEIAFQAAKIALEAHLSLDNYLAIEKIAPDWDAIKPAMLNIVAQSSHKQAQVDIYLHERMDQAVMTIIDEATYWRDIDKVIDTLKVDHPRWAFRQCHLFADAIMDAGKSKDYRSAARWLERGRDILLAAGDNTYWQTHISQTMETHQRKYTLMPLLKAL